MTWADELQAMLGQARGDLGLFLGLVALRRCEWGGAGKEFGVISVVATTYGAQLHTAAVSFKAHEQRIGLTFRVRSLETGWYTDEFLTDFSHRWAPVGAENDPEGLNRNHAGNLVRLYHQLSTPLIEAIFHLPSGHEEPPAAA